MNIYNNFATITKFIVNEATNYQVIQQINYII